MGKNEPISCGKNANLSTLSTEFSTFNLRSPTWSVKRKTDPNLSTIHSQHIHNPVETKTPAFPTRLFGVFHKFPTPYYEYYNKFNKIDRF